MTFPGHTHDDHLDMGASMEPSKNTELGICEKLEALDVLALVKDPALYIALAAIVMRLIPAVGEWHEENKDVMIPLYLVLAGHFGIRWKAAAAKGKVLETDTLMEGQLR